MHLEGFRVSLYVGVVAVLAVSAVAQAQTSSSSAAAVEVSEAPAVEVSEFSLDTLMSRPEQILLQNAADRYTFYIPLSPRVRLRRATLALAFTNSISMFEPRSQLRVRVNGRVVGQTLLDARNPVRELSVDIPPDLMEPGYNEMEIQVAQHYASQCENPMAPELWTNIDTSRSRLKFEYELNEIQTSLAEIPILINPLGWNPYRLTIMTVTSKLQEFDLALGAVLSEGVATSLKYRPLKVSHAVALPVPEEIGETASGRVALIGNPADADATLFGTSAKASHAVMLPASEEVRESALGRVALIGNPADADAILFGTSDKVARFLPDKIAQEIVGPYIGLMRHVADRSRFVLLISGRDRDELAIAARAFLLAGAELPDVASMTVSDTSAPEVPRYANANAIEAGHRYALSSFGVQTKTLRSGTDSVEFEIWLPPDLFVPASSALEVHLHMAYGGGSDPGSVINLDLNGEFSSAIRLVSEDGGIFLDYVISLPASRLRAGSNTLRFTAHMAPMTKSDVCFTPSSAGLVASIFDDSWLLLTEARHHVELPNLRLTARTGFPLSSPADGSELHVRTTSLNHDVVASAWTLLGKVTQLGAIAPWKVTIGTNPAEPGRHELIVGPIGELPPELIAAAPVRFGPSGLLKAVVLEMAHGQKDSKTVRRLFSVGQSLAQPQAVVQALASVDYEAGPDDRTYMLQFESPTEAGRLVTLVTSVSNSSLRKGVDRLVEFDLWGSLDGDLAVWDLSADSARTTRIGSRFHIGQPDLQSRASFFFSQRPWLWISLLVATALLFAITSVSLLRQRARRNRT